MSSAATRAFFMLLGGAVIAPAPPPATFDIRTIWLKGAQPSATASAETIRTNIRTIWLKG